MSSSFLNEYRCSCGRLLFKGLLFQCVIEVKCKRCASLASWAPFEPVRYASVESNADQEVTGASGDLAAVLGCDGAQLIGKRLVELFPLMRDMPSGTAPGAVHEGYALPETTLVLGDGSFQRVRSYVVPRIEKGACVGYRVVSVLKP